MPDLPADTSLEIRVDLLIDTVYAMYETGGPAAAAIYRKSGEHPTVRRLKGVWDDYPSQTISSVLGGYINDED